MTDRIKKFYWCANAIFRIDGRLNDTVMLHLIETHCVPLLTYGIEIIHVKDRDERRQLRVAYNSVFQKIFGYRWSESVTALQGFLSRPTWEELVEKRQSSFFARTANHHLANALSSMWLTFSWSHVNQRRKKCLSMFTRLCGLLRRNEPHLFSFCFWYRLNTIVRL